MVCAGILIWTNLFQGEGKINSNMQISMCVGEGGTILIPRHGLCWNFEGQVIKMVRAGLRLHI